MVTTFAHGTDGSGDPYVYPVTEKKRGSKYDSDSPITFADSFTDESEELERLHNFGDERINNFEKTPPEETYEEWVERMEKRNEMYNNDGSDEDDPYKDYDVKPDGFFHGSKGSSGQKERTVSPGDINNPQDVLNEIKKIMDSDLSTKDKLIWLKSIEGHDVKFDLLTKDQQNALKNSIAELESKRADFSMDELDVDDLINDVLADYDSTEDQLTALKEYKKTFSKNINTDGIKLLDSQISRHEEFLKQESSNKKSKKSKPSRTGPQKTQSKQTSSNDMNLDLVKHRLSPRIAELFSQ